MKKNDESNGFKQFKRKIGPAMFLMLSFCMLSINLMAQNVTVTGNVKNASGETIPGVTVIVKGTTNGTITDSNGNYSLGKVPSVAFLVFSFVGMKTQEIAVAWKNQINIIMVEESVEVEEIVAIGYGTVRRKDLTGSVTSVSGNTLKDIPVTSASRAIVGRMPGVLVTQTEGSPDAEIKIRVRGGGSITQDNSPLYIVDGFPVNNIDDISPTDIESIDVLKDASSTAIYGARGANGVILVTTKSGGFEERGKISYNTYWGVKNITKTLDVLDPYEYAFYQYEQKYSSFETNYGVFQDLKLYKQMDGANWQNKLFGRTGTSMNHNIAISGGSKTSKYNINFTRNDEKEIMLGSGYSKTNLTVKSYNKVNKWLTIDFNTRLSDYNLKGAGTSRNSRLQYAVQYRPVEGLMSFVDQDIVDQGTYEAYNVMNKNPIDQTNDDYRRYKSLLAYFNSAATIQISKFFKFRLEVGAQFGENTTKQFYGINTTNVRQYAGMPMAENVQYDSRAYRLANTLTFFKENFIAKGHTLTAMVGEELNYDDSESITSSAKYFPKYINAVSALSMMNLGTPDPITTSDNPEVTISSFFGRLNYDYKGKYLAATTFRADGSSKFAPGHQWGYFPSFALAWRISKEKFMGRYNDSWLDDLKLRVSYGESGNNRISNNVWQKTFYVSANTLFLDGDGGGGSATAYISPKSVLSNPELKWETTITRNIGLDYILLKKRLNGSVEIYKNTTNDLLITASIPSSSGYSTQWQNIGQTSNKGLEIVLNGVILEKKDFKLSASFNIAFNRNRIDKLGDAKSWEQSSNWLDTGPTGDYLIKEGGKVGLMYGYETEGMYAVDDFDYNNGTYTLKKGVPDDHALLGQNRFWPGSLKLKDQNGDMIVNAADKVVIGDANPKHTGGFNLTAQCKGFDFSAFFNWVYGNDIYNANKLKFTSYYGYPYLNLLSIMNSENRFTYYSRETGELVSDPVKLAEMNKNAKIWSPGMINIPLHSWAIEDGSFLRLNNLTIGYNLPKRLLNKLKFQQLRVYASAYNLWIWTNYSGYDPEVDTRRSTPLTPGIDWCAYPRSRSFNIGLNVEF
jgi:TonB-linked SusC/RagA family outer membrane protein